MAEVERLWVSIALLCVCVAVECVCCGVVSGLEPLSLSSRIALCRWAEGRGHNTKRLAFGAILAKMCIAGHHCPSGIAEAALGLYYNEPMHAEYPTFAYP